MHIHGRDRWLAINYAATIFTSAFLLFQIQPLISKYILPWFGGSPAVWTTCLLFFQTLLFAGYAYAHLIHRRLRPPQQAIVHVSLIVVSIALLGVLPGNQWEPRGDHDPVGRILLILTLSVGLPYFVLAATGPLLQAWFARSFPDRVPYRLYALSNAGSLLALLSYPFFFERQFDLPRQAAIWSVGFIVYAALCVYAAWRLWTRSRVSPVEDSTCRTFDDKCQSGSTTWAPPRPRQRLLWLIWPACGSIVLMATTNHVSTDVAVMPFLWVAPLALYLLTFIIAFDRPHWYRRTLVAALSLAAIYAAAFVHKNGVGPVDADDCGTVVRLYLLITNPAAGDEPAAAPLFRVSSLQFLVVNFAAMFFICLVCHGELVRHRPHPTYLTSFYLMIAAGGALGGAFVTLVAPLVFKTYIEWELSLLLACVFAIGVILRAFVNFVLGIEDSTAPTRRLFLLPPLAVAAFLPAAVALLDLAEFLPHSNAGIQQRTRNFFGALAVRERDVGDPLHHNFVLQHGAIRHGAQFTHESRRREPTTYFSLSSGVGRAINYYRAQWPADGMRLGVVGLGVGTLAAYADEGDRIWFYEINPAVIDIAERRRWFTYLQDCRARGASCEIKLGDGRLTLRRELASNSNNSPPHFGEGPGEGRPSNPRFHLLALDAFSGDSVPVHLLTVEAFEIYLAHVSVSPDIVGAVAVNISNRFVDLEPVLRGAAAHFGLRWVRIHNRADSALGIYSADWIILSRNEALMDSLAPFARTSTAPPKPAVLWTDAHSSLFDVLK